MIEFLSDPISLIAIAIAGFAGFKLWNTFGDNTHAPPARQENPEPKIEPIVKQVKELAPPPSTPIWQTYAEEGSPVAKTLTDLNQIDPSFTCGAFMTFAKNQFEHVSTDFAQGNLQSLQAALEPDIFKLFQDEITMRKGQGLTNTFKLIGITAIKLIEASLQNNKAELTVEIRAEAISAAQDQKGNIKSGSLEKVSHLIEEWTFARQLDVKNSTWRLAAT